MNYERKPMELKKAAMPATEHPFIRAWLRGYIAWDRDASLAALAAAEYDQQQPCQA